MHCKVYGFIKSEKTSVHTSLLILTMAGLYHPGTVVSQTVSRYKYSRCDGLSPPGCIRSDMALPKVKSALQVQRIFIVRFWFVSVCIQIYSANLQGSDLP